MNILRRNAEGLATGDPIPFYHDGTYHLFYLSDPANTTRYPERCRNTWEHLVSKDLVNWEELPSVLKPGDGTDLDEDGCWTGSVIYGEGKFHIFYTAYQINSKNPQKICHATSDDCITWEKDPANPVIIPNHGLDQPLYEDIDWRDAYCFYNEEDKCYWMLIAARYNYGPDNRRGCVVLYKSKDLVNFEHYGAIYSPWHTNCPECPEMYKLGDYWYLSYSRFSERGQTLYRYSKSPYGPWRTPKFDGIDCRRFYAAKSVINDEGRCIYFAWCHERENNSDEGWWQSGGDFIIPHEVESLPSGDLNVKIPYEIYDTFTKPLSFTYKPMLGNSKMYGDKAIAVDSIGTLTYGYFQPSEKEFMFECDVRANDCGDYFGIALNTDDDLDNGYLLALEMAGQRAYLNKIPAPLDPFWSQLTGRPIAASEVDGPRPLEKPFVFNNGDYINIKIVYTDTLFEIFIDGRVAFTYRAYTKSPNSIGVFAQDCSVEYHNISFRTQQ